MNNTCHGVNGFGLHVRMWQIQTIWSFESDEIQAKKTNYTDGWDPSQGSVRKKEIKKRKEDGADTKTKIWKDLGKQTSV